MPVSLLPFDSFTTSCQRVSIAQEPEYRVRGPIFTMGDGGGFGGWFWGRLGGIFFFSCGRINEKLVFKNLAFQYYDISTIK